MKSGLENMNLPPRDVMKKLYLMDPIETSDDEAIGIFQSFFAGPKPLVGLLSLKDLKTNSILLDVSLDKLNIANPSTSPIPLKCLWNTSRCPWPSCRNSNCSRSWACRK